MATGPPTKFMVLEGIGTIYPRGHPEKAATVHGGEMVMMTADKKITQPEKFDVKLVLETSALIVDFPPLTNLPLILTVMNQQLAEQQLAGTTSQRSCQEFDRRHRRDRSKRQLEPDSNCGQKYNTGSPSNADSVDNSATNSNSVDNSATNSDSVNNSASNSEQVWDTNYDHFAEPVPHYERNGDYDRPLYHDEWRN